jgi:DNA-binding winged helix-turn-helix (wHTH) protein
VGGEVLRFDGWELDLSRGRLSRDGRVVPLRRKGVELLAYLVRHAGRMVSREELLAAVWPDVHVSVTTLATAIHEIRSTLAQCAAGGGTSIRNVYGHGYQLDPTVEAGDVPSASTQATMAQTDSPCSVAGFVGRRALLTEIERTLSATRGGLGRAIFLVGEPGIGKSSTLLEVARWARDRAFAVHVAGCLAAEAAPPAWPWARLLRSLLASCSQSRRLELEQRYAPALQLLPEHRRGDSASRRGTALRSPPPLGFPHREAFIGLLHERAQEQPQLLVLDDLQAADVGSLELLRHVVRSLPGAAAFVVGAARHDAPPDGGAVDELLADLDTRSRIATLRGLEVAEIEELVATATGQQAPLDVARVLLARTGGNPLLVTEIARALESDHALDDPERARRVLPPRAARWEAARLALLGAAAKRLLARAAGLGASFRAEELCRGFVAPEGEPSERLLALALRSGVLVREGTERLRFARTLSWEVLATGTE